MSSIVGFVGLGRMGLPMCARLVQAGHTVRAGDRRPALAAVAAAAGVGWRDGARNVARGADVLITMLPGAGEVLEVMVGEDGALDALAPGASWIDMSSGTAVTLHDVGERARARGIAVLDAPVGGDPSRAAAGTLQLFVGGEAGALERHRDLLEAMADPQRIHHVGPAGSGYTTKLLVNLLWFGQAVATAEALLVGQRAGIDLGVLRDVLGASAGASVFVDRDLDRLLDGDYMESFGLDRCWEELEAITALADRFGLDFELSRLVGRMYGRALERFGPRDGELLGVALLEQEAGTTLRRGRSG